MTHEEAAAHILPAGQTIAEVAADEMGPGYLRWLSAERATDAATVSAILAYLSHRPEGPTADERRRRPE